MRVQAVRHGRGQGREARKDLLQRFRCRAVQEDAAERVAASDQAGQGRFERLPGEKVVRRARAETQQDRESGLPRRLERGLGLAQTVHRLDDDQVDAE